MVCFIITSLTFLLLVPANLLAQSPKGYLSSPASFTVINTNIMRFRTEVTDTGKGIVRVNFFASFWNAKGKMNRKKLIGSDSIPPFECLWDCTDIPDQDMYRMSFGCELIDRQGNTYRDSGDSIRNIVLDRNEDFAQACLLAKKVDKPLKIDGYLDDWKGHFPQSFTGNDNRINFWSAWDSKALYFAVYVSDNLIFAQKADLRDASYKPDSRKEFNGLWRSDYIEFSFDTRHSRKSLRDRDDREFLVNGLGQFEGVALDLKQRANYPWGRDALVKVRVKGSCRSDAVADTGFVVEAALPWKSLDILPGDIDTIGFDLFNGDIETPGGERTFASWSGVARIQNDNPSEWGNLVLVRPSKIGTILLALCILAVLSVLVVLVRQKRRQKKIAEIKNSDVIVKRAKQYMEDHYREKIDRKTLAHHAHLSEQYFGHLYKKEAGETFLETLNKIRVREAGKLLSSTGMKVIDVSLEVGYENLSSFLKIFKKYEKISPLEYRRKSSKNA